MGMTPYLNAWKCGAELVSLEVSHDAEYERKLNALK